jgi:hypothetical protein
MHRISRVVRCSRAGLPAGAVYIGRAAPGPGCRRARSPTRSGWPTGTTGPLGAAVCTSTGTGCTRQPSATRPSAANSNGSAAPTWRAGAHPPRATATSSSAGCYATRPADDRAAAALAAQLAAAAAVLGPAHAASLAVVGSKQLPDRLVPLARAIVLDELLRLRPEWVMSGGARGIDTVAAKAARALGFDPPHQLIEILPTPMVDPPPGRALSAGRVCAAQPRDRHDLYGIVAAGERYQPDLRQRVDSRSDRAARQAGRADPAGRRCAMTTTATVAGPFPYRADGQLMLWADPALGVNIDLTRYSVILLSTSAVL